MANIVNMVTVAEFETEVKQAKGAVMVDFWAPWCGPCKMITPIVDQLAEQFEGMVKVCKVNIDEGGELAEPLDVMGVPTLIFFLNGEEVKRIVGNRPEELKQAFEEFSNRE